MVTVDFEAGVAAEIRGHPFEDEASQEGPGSGLKPVWHVLAIALIVAASLLLFYKSFTTPGTIMTADNAWPTTLNRVNQMFVNTWWQYGSWPNIVFIQLLWPVSLLKVAQVLRLSVSQYVLFMYLFVLSLAGISMYALAYKVIGSFKTKETSWYAVLAGSVLAAIVYMYNPWSITHLWSYFLFVPYALLPLIFIVMWRALDRSSLRYAVLLGLLLSLGNTHFFGTVFLWFIVITFTVFYILKNRFKRASLLPALKTVGATLFVYLLVNAFWLLPYAQALISGKPFLPQYVPPLTKSMLEGMSSGSPVLHNLRLVGGWAWDVSPMPTSGFATFLSFVLPVAAITSLIVMRDRIRKSTAMNYWSVMFVLTIILATGTSFIIKRPYEYIVLGGPGSALFGWTIREPDRWLALVGPFYALSIGALLAWLPGRALELPFLKASKGKKGGS